MSLTRAIVGNRHAVWAAALGIALLGAYSYLRLPMQLFPDTAPPLVNVLTPWPGAGATDVAADLNRPLEQELAALDGIARVRSTAQDNLSLISLEFQFGREAALAAIDAQNAIARVRGELPEGVGEPQVLTFSTSDRPVFTLGVAAEDLVQARRLAEDVFAPRLQRVDSVAAVDVFGGAVPGVLVDVEPSALFAHRIPLERIAAALKQNNASSPAGRVRSESSQVMLRVDERAGDLEGLAAAPLGIPGGAQITVGDLAEVRRGAFDDDARFAVGGRRAIALQIFKADDANTVEVVRSVRRAVAELAREHPDLELIPGEESATFTELSVSNLLENIWQALALAAAIIFLFLGRLRASAVAIVSMPLSYALTFGLMLAFGVELNMVTLSAVILAVGMVVDASVVVLENIVRVRDTSSGTMEDAAVAGADEVRLAIFAGAATTVVVLVPLLFLAGFIGRVFGPLALTLIFAFLSSVVVALVLVPVLAIYTDGRSHLDRIGERVASPFLKLMDGLRAVAVRVLSVALRFRVPTVMLALASFVLGVLGMRAAGMDVLPKMDGGSFFVSLETPSGSSLDQTSAAVAEVERILQEEPDVVLVQSQVGFEPGMRFLGGSGALGPTQGFVTATLTPRTARETSIWEIEARVREKIARIPGLESAVVKELGNTAKATTTAPVVVRVTGPDPLVLDRLGDEVLARVRGVPSVVEPARSWRRDQRRVRVEVDEVRAARLGLSPVEVGRRLALGAEGVPAGDYRGAEGSPEPIRVRFSADDHPEPDDVLDWPLFPAQPGEPIPVRSVASMSDVDDQAVFTREQLSPSLDVTAFVDGRPLSFVVTDVERALADVVVPAGYSVDVVGENSDLAESRGELARALLLSVIAVYLVLVAQFRSFVHPITVMMAVPLSISGVALALFLGGKPVSMPVMVGLVLLVGTVVNSSIILVDFVRREREAGRPRREALLAAVGTRFRPIMMTSLSTIVGMIPLAAEWALGAERFSPLALGVIGGMATSTVLTLIIIPVLYDLAEDAVAALRRRPRRAPAAVVVGLAGLAALASASSARADEPLHLDLVTAQRMAEERSPALLARGEEVEAAEARSRAAIGRFLPRVSTQLRYSKLSEVEPPLVEIPLTLPNGDKPDPVALGDAIDEQYSARASIEQPLFTGGALFFGWRAAERGVDVARHRSASTRAELRLSAAEAYFAAIKSEEMAEVAERSAATLADHLARLERLFEAGRATSLDLARARARLAEAEESRGTARAAAEMARVGLLSLLGLPPETSVVLSEPLTTEPSSLELDDVERAALSGRADLLVARAAAELKEERANATRAGLLPKVAARVGFQYENPNQRYFPMKDEWNGSWDASLVLSWDAWDWGATFHEWSASQHDAAAARRQVAVLEERTRLEVNQARRRVADAVERVEARERSAEAAEEALQSAERLFEGGLATSLDVLGAETELTRARAKLIEARVDARLARARLERLLGDVDSPGS